MSLAGIRSNRGDGYQTLVAIDWALTAISDPEFEWIEIDSVKYHVDDVVAGRKDGSIVCCQCKKNQTDFYVWTISDLKDELIKASTLLVREPKACVRFYSRSPFGLLHKLSEHRATQPDETQYRASLTEEHRRADSALQAILAEGAAGVSTFDFIRRVSFESSPELDRMEQLVRERLRAIASNENAAFDALWRALDQLAARLGKNAPLTTGGHRLSKGDLVGTLANAGSLLAPIFDEEKSIAQFASISSIGRSWRRDIAGRRVSVNAIDQLLEALAQGHRSILVTGLPGSGKTCVMLGLQEALERRASVYRDVIPLFIQSREFADLASSSDRASQGLSSSWVEEAARLSDRAKVVVVIDSLDVLSIAREHATITYFLSQIDRLLQIHNVSVVTACRNFDRHYDRRIAVRSWDFELQCEPFEWESSCHPLLEGLGIKTDGIDEVTRKLICNPREMALFVDLALHGESFNVPDSQFLAQRYLDVVVRSDPELGLEALEVIESIAKEMLNARSLTVPHQRSNASTEMLRKLQSLDILRESSDGGLTFGHQTLLDVLVISDAIRSGTSLVDFIGGLPPVPFVRPSIRAFVGRLAAGSRRECRKQLRVIFAGSMPFHLRRLVAEVFTESAPDNDDWPLVRDLRAKQTELFQVIYANASRVEWHHFWMNHLVPHLKETRDAEGLLAHAYHVARWMNLDPDGCIAFWLDVTSLDYIDVERLYDQIAFYLSSIDSKYLAKARVLISRLTADPRMSDHSVGNLLARSVEAGLASDDDLWRYIAGAVTEEDVVEHRLSNKLRCDCYSFSQSDNAFIRDRMRTSTRLLDLAVRAVESWSDLRVAAKGPWMTGRLGFLGETSYRKAHTKSDINHEDSQNVLLDAMEASISDHAMAGSDWWRRNCDRLCSSSDSALQYFAINALATAPEDEVGAVAALLCDRPTMESELDYEVGSLIHGRFVHLSPSDQTKVMDVISSTYRDAGVEDARQWVWMHRAKLASFVPAHLRSTELQEYVDRYVESFGQIWRSPTIYRQGGVVRAPFSFQNFLDLSDDNVVRLIGHYQAVDRDHSDFLVGGAREVGWQLREASSRAPMRFLAILTRCWSDIPSNFKDDIVDGASSYLAQSVGDLQKNGSWTPLESPDPIILARQILETLEDHPDHWWHKRALSSALQACSYVIDDEPDSDRIAFLAAGFMCLREESAIHGDSVDLLTTGINMMSGHVAEALAILSSNFAEKGATIPRLLRSLLRYFASHDHPAIRALIIRRLPYLQGRDADIGWELFERAMREPEGLWSIAEPCFYHAYFDTYDRIVPWLAKIREVGVGRDLETWGRISALAALRGHIEIADLLAEVEELDSGEAWRGCATVWCHPNNFQENSDQCVKGLESGLRLKSCIAAPVADCLQNLFSNESSPVLVPIDLVALWFGALGKIKEGRQGHLVGFQEWLNAVAQRDPDLAIASAEFYLASVKRTAKQYFYDYENSLTQMMTRLFAEAEEREDSDGGKMLQRVVRLQDNLLSLGLDGLKKWLVAAERP